MSPDDFHNNVVWFWYVCEPHLRKNECDLWKNIMFEWDSYMGEWCSLFGFSDSDLKRSCTNYWSTLLIISCEVHSWTKLLSSRLTITFWPGFHVNTTVYLFAIMSVVNLPTFMSIMKVKQSSNYTLLTLQWNLLLNTHIHSNQYSVYLYFVSAPPDPGGNFSHIPDRQKFRERDISWCADYRTGSQHRWYSYDYSLLSVADNQTHRQHTQHNLLPNTRHKYTHLRTHSRHSQSSVRHSCAVISEPYLFVRMCVCSALSSGRLAMHPASIHI